jgi:antitoxin HicB
MIAEAPDVPGTMTVGGDRAEALERMRGELLLLLSVRMQERGVTQVDLARGLGCDDRQVRRLLDLEHRSRLDQMEAALHVLEQRLSPDIQNAA